MFNIIAVIHAGIKEHFSVSFENAMSDGRFFAISKLKLLEMSSILTIEF